jgi:glycosyltransferase involved in cell wall biosynthesis
VPFVTTYHGIYGEQNRIKKLYNSVMASGDRVIANSAFTAELVRARYGTPAERLVVIDRGVDERVFDPARIDPAAVAALRSAWGLRPGTRAIVLAGRLTGWKGQSVLIRAAARLRADGAADFAVVLVGSDQGRGGYRAGLDTLVAEHRLGDIVRFAGHSDDMAAVFAAADIAVSASTRPEAFGRAIVEAEAMQTPVVVTDLGPTRETVLVPPAVDAAMRTGWIVPPDDADALAAALAEALATAPEDLADIGARGRAHVLERFTLQRMTGATLDLYRAVLHEMRTPSAFS